MLKSNSQFNRLESLISVLDNRPKKTGYLLLTPEGIQIIILNTSHKSSDVTQIKNNRMIPESVSPLSDNKYPYETSDLQIPKTIPKLIRLVDYGRTLVFSTPPDSKTKIKESPSQAYIQSKPALKECHDFFLNSLESRITVRRLSATGDLSRTNLTCSLLSGVSGALDFISQRRTIKTYPSDIRAGESNEHAPER